MYYVFLYQKEWFVASKFPQSPNENTETSNESIENMSGSPLETTYRDIFDNFPRETAAEITEFRYRANKLTRTARAVLVCMVFVLIFAAFVVVFAGQIAEFGTARISPYLDLMRDRAALVQKIASNDRDISRIKSMIDQTKIEIQKRKKEANGEGEA